MSSRGLKNYGWKNVREMKKNLSLGNSTSRKHGLKMGVPQLELLARSRCPLFKFPHQWTPIQKIRANVLFLLYLEIEQAYDLSWHSGILSEKKYRLSLLAN